MMGWRSFLATILIALIVGSISKVFRDARGGNFFAALLGSQLGVLLISSVHAARWVKMSKGISAVLCAILVTWLFSLGVEEDKEPTEASGENTENKP